MAKMKIENEISCPQDPQDWIIDFANRIATAMKEISSSHVYFIIQQAYGEIDWTEAERILKLVIKLTKKDSDEKDPAKPEQD